jgi:Ca-activated chloride channel family protein
MTRRLVLQLLFISAGAVPLVGATHQSSQTIDATGTQVFRSHADLVVLHVNVFDDRSDSVPDLPQSAFRIFEDGRPQEITFFSGADVPVAAGLIIDNSSSMITRRSMVAAGTRAFIDSSHPEDELFSISFNEHVAHGLPDSMPFTQSHAMLTVAATRFSAGGKTALFDAVIEGLNHLERSSHQKRVLVVISDGDDNASRESEKAMLDRALRSNTIIYTVATTIDGLDGDGDVLKKLAKISGGLAYFPRSEQQVVKSLEEVAGNIRRGYSIGYAPATTAPDGSFHRVKVDVRVPGRPKLSVRARDGYRASTPDPPTAER